MKIKILNVDINDAGTGTKKYQVAEVLYDTNGNKRTFKIFSFANPAVFKTVKDAKNGDFFEVKVEKNDKGYDSWAAIEASDGSASASTPAAAVSGKTGGASFSGDRESKDEREARQRYIIRQSSLSNAIAVLTAGAKAPPKVEEVTELAEKFVAFVFDLPDIFDASFPNDDPEA